MHLPSSLSILSPGGRHLLPPALLCFPPTCSLREDNDAGNSTVRWQSGRGDTRQMRWDMPAAGQLTSRSIWLFSGWVARARPAVRQTPASG